MKQVVFYEIESDFISIALKIVEKFYQANEHVLFLCDSDDEIAFYNSKLWTFSKLQFIPSGNKSTISKENARHCHTWFSTELELLNEPSVLIHNGLDLSKFQGVEKFDKIIDIFSISRHNELDQKSNLYKNLGFDDQKLWIQNGSAWKQGELKT